MKKFLILVLSVMMAQVVALPLAHAEGVTVRLYLMYFDGDITTETTTADYHEFTNIDPETRLYDFQEFYIKQQFPEFASYGHTVDTALVYTDSTRGLYDGMNATIGQMIDQTAPEEARYAGVYLWLASTYIHVIMETPGMEGTSEIVYEYVEASDMGEFAAGHMDGSDVEGIDATTNSLTQVFLNRRSVAMRIKGKDGFVSFTEKVTREADGSIRLTLTTETASDGAELDYTQMAILYLGNTLSIGEVVFVNGANETSYPMDELRAAVGIVNDPD